MYLINAKYIERDSITLTVTIGRLRMKGYDKSVIEQGKPTHMVIIDKRNMDLDFTDLDHNALKWAPSPVNRKPPHLGRPSPFLRLFLLLLVEEFVVRVLAFITLSITVHLHRIIQGLQLVHIHNLFTKQVTGWPLEINKTVKTPIKLKEELEIYRHK